ncbi:hypothetical protein NEUTE1DRAFT_38109, partial [Neurospora tetrasperma FGSC 2508]
TKLGITSLFGPCVLRGVHGKGAISCHFSCHLFILKEEKKKKFRVKRKREAKVTPHMVQTAKVSPRKGTKQYEEKGRHHYHLPYNPGRRATSIWTGPYRY